MEVLHEIYFGKQSQLLKLEDLFTKIRGKYNKEDILGNLQSYRELLKDHSNIIIGETISNVFGFNETMFTFANDKSFNAYTVPFPIDREGNVYDGDDKLIVSNKYRDKSIIVDNKGIRYDKNVFKINFLVCVNTGLFFSDLITVPQLVSVLLHEIGHTFSKALIEYKILNDRMDEKFADQFVAMYGYGPEYIKVMDLFAKPKYGVIEDKLTKVPVVNLFIGISKVWRYALIRSWANDEHPALYVRMQSQIAQLESDLKNTPNLSPTMRKEMLKQIEECKRRMDSSFDFGDDNGSNKVVRYYYKDFEPNMYAEKKENRRADKHSNPDAINDRLRKLYKGKGRRK